MIRTQLKKAVVVVLLLLFVVVDWFAELFGVRHSPGGGPLVGDGDDAVTSFEPEPIPDDPINAEPDEVETVPISDVLEDADPTEYTVQRCPACGAIALRGAELGFDRDVPACPRAPCLVATFYPTRYADEQSIYDEVDSIEHAERSAVEIPLTDSEDTDA